MEAAAAQPNVSPTRARSRFQTMSRSDADLQSIHSFSSLHRPLMERSQRAGCFYCLAEFAPSTITEWVDAPEDASDDEALSVGVTALCPRCGIDSVLPSAAPIKWDESLLVEMRAFWFSQRV